MVQPVAFRCVECLIHLGVAKCPSIFEYIRAADSLFAPMGMRFIFGNGTAGVPMLTEDTKNILPRIEIEVGTGSMHREDLMRCCA